MFFKKGRGALWVCIWNRGGGGPKKFGNHWFRGSKHVRVELFFYLNRHTRNGFLFILWIASAIYTQSWINLCILLAQMRDNPSTSVISGFRRDVDEICPLLVCGSIWSNGSSVPTFRDNVSVPSSRIKTSPDFLILEEGTYTLSLNVGKWLPLDAA